MSADKPADKALTDPGYEVGYGRPPVSTQFKPGQSGNPKGGSKKRAGGVPTSTALDFASQPANKLLMEEVYRIISVREGGKVVRMTVAQANFRAMTVLALKGDRLAQRMLAQQIQDVENAARDERAKLFESAIQYKTFWENAIQESRARGWKEPTPVPHPDDIIIDLRTPAVIIAGPNTPEEKVEFDAVLARRDRLLHFVGHFAEAYHGATLADEQEHLFDLWEAYYRKFERLNGSLPMRYRIEISSRLCADYAPHSFAREDRDAQNRLV